MGHLRTLVCFRLCAVFNQLEAKAHSHWRRVNNGKNINFALFWFPIRFSLSSISQKPFAQRYMVIVWPFPKFIGMFWWWIMLFNHLTLRCRRWAATGYYGCCTGFFSLCGKCLQKPERFVCLSIWPLFLFPSRSLVFLTHSCRTFDSCGYTARLSQSPGNIRRWHSTFQIVQLPSGSHIFAMHAGSSTFLCSASRHDAWVVFAWRRKRRRWRWDRQRQIVDDEEAESAKVKTRQIETK